MEFLDKLLTDFANWLGEKLKELIDWVLSGILNALASIIELIPVPAFFTDASSAFASIPSEIVFFMGPLELGYGIGVVLSAYTLRFIIRRIPLFG